MAFSDDFNRADGVIGTGWGTASHFAPFKVASNAATPNSLAFDSSSLYTGGTFSDDQYAEVDWSATGGGAGDQTGVGVYLRGSIGPSGGTPSGYWVVANAAATNNISVSSWGGTYTLLGQITHPMTAGDVLRAEITGTGSATTIKVFVNGTQVGSDIADTASTKTSSGTPGIAYSTALSAASVDNFAAGDVVGGGGSSISTGEISFTAAQSVSESPHIDEPWVNPTNALADDGTNASVTATTFDNGDQTQILKVYNASVALAAALPSSLASIDGVIIRINGYSDSASAVDFDLVQLLDTTRVKVGTNQAATSVAMGTSTSAVHTFGSATDLWGLSLTRAWLIDADFGVGIGVLAQANNSEAYIDNVTVEVWYTPASGTPWSTSPSDTITLSDAAGKKPVKKPADTITLSDAITRAWVAAKALADTITATDAPSKKPALPKADTLTLSDATTRVTGKSQALADTLTLSDAAGKAPKVIRSDTLTLADALTRAWAAVRALADTTTLSDASGRKPVIGRGDTLTLADLATKAPKVGRADTTTLSDAAAKAPKMARSDTLTLTDAQVKAIIALRADLLTLADLADPQLSTGGSGLTKSLADILTLADALGQLLVLAKADTVTLTDASAKAVRPGKADTLTLADAAAKAVGVKRADTVSLADALGKGIVVHPTDTVTSTDARGKSVAHAASDLVSLSDASAKAMGLRPGDSMTMSDVINIVGGTQSFTLSLSDTLSLGDDLARALNGDYLGGDGRTIRTIILSRFGIY